MYLYLGIAIVILLLLLMLLAYYIYSPPATVSTPASTLAPTYTPVATPAKVLTQTVYGNNGTVSCETYCKGNNGGPWNDELPKEWNGAKCVASSVGDCNAAPGLMKGLKCTCAKTGTGWA